MIVPTIGRVVWYRPCEDAGAIWAALVTYVWSDTVVNLAVFDHNGCCQSRRSVSLHQDANSPAPAGSCEWMPYQKAVASGQQQPNLHQVAAQGL